MAQELKPNSLSSKDTGDFPPELKLHRIDLASRAQPQQTKLDGESTLDTGCHFDGSISKFDDVLLEHGGLHHVLPLPVHLKFVWLEK